MTGRFLRGSLLVLCLMLPAWAHAQENAGDLHGVFPTS